MHLSEIASVAPGTQHRSTVHLPRNHICLSHLCHLLIHTADSYVTAENVCHRPLLNPSTGSGTLLGLHTQPAYGISSTSLKTYFQSPHSNRPFDPITTPYLLSSSNTWHHLSP